MMNCPDLNALSAYAEKRLTDSEIRQVEEHLERCDRCLELTAGLLAESAESDEETVGMTADYAASLVSATQASRLAVGRNDGALRIVDQHRLKVDTPSAFGKRFSVTSIFRHPVLPLRSFGFDLDNPVLDHGLLFPQGESFSLHLHPREDSRPEELEILSGGNLLRNAYAGPDGDFEIERLPRKRTLLIRERASRRTLLVLQISSDALSASDWAKLGVYLASQGEFDEAARLFEQHALNNKATRKLHRIYEILRYGSVCYPRELAVLRKKQGPPRRNSDSEPPEELPILKRVAESYALDRHYKPSGKFVLGGLEAARRGDWAEAERLWAESHFLRADPILTAAQGWACLLNDKRQEAVQWFEFVLTQIPDQEDAVMGLEFARRVDPGADGGDEAESVLADLLWESSRELESGEE